MKSITILQENMWLLQIQTEAHISLNFLLVMHEILNSFSHCSVGLVPAPVSTLLKTREIFSSRSLSRSRRLSRAHHHRNNKWEMSLLHDVFEFVSQRSTTRRSLGV